MFNTSSNESIDINNFDGFYQSLQEQFKDELNSLRADNAIVNMHLGLGLKNRDKLASSSVGEGRKFSRKELDTLRYYNPMFGNLVELLPDAMTAEFVTYNCESQELRDWMQEQLNIVKPFINEALKEARGQGGAGLILYADDGGTDYSMPLSMKKLKAIAGYRVLSPEDLPLEEREEDITSIDYGEPKYYKFAGTDKLIHASRVLPFHGIKLPVRMHDVNYGWGLSVIARGYDKVSNLDQSDNLVANSLMSFNQIIIYISKLGEKLLQGKQRQLEERANMISRLLSALGILLLDKENETYEIAKRDYAGVKDLLEHAKQMAGGACDIPLTLLFNRSPSGLTSGSSEAESWANYVFARQNTDMMPQVKTLIKLWHLCKNNPVSGNPPKWYELKQPSIHKLTKEEEANLAEKHANAKDKEATAIQKLINSGVYDSLEVAKAKKEGIPLDQAIDLEARLTDIQGVEEES